MLIVLISLSRKVTENGIKEDWKGNTQTPCKQWQIGYYFSWVLLWSHILGSCKLDKHILSHLKVPFEVEPFLIKRTATCQSWVTNTKVSYCNVVVTHILNSYSESQTIHIAPIGHRSSLAFSQEKSELFAWQNASLSWKQVDGWTSRDHLATLHQLII